jgi:hypothetical protein
VLAADLIAALSASGVGTVVCDFSSGITEALHTTADGLVSCQADNLLLGLDTGGDLSDSDGTTVTALDINLDRNIRYRAAVKWGHVASKKAVGGGIPGSIAWTADANFDGAFAQGANLLIGNGLAYPLSIRKVWIFNRPLSNDQINNLR